jgi:hypothetical protein
MLSIVTFVGVIIINVVLLISIKNILRTIHKNEHELQANLQWLESHRIERID